ncbi:MAG: histidine triad (HIT) family protein [Cyclobacteriaceae bacterium]|jgi:histidine triad (HIT) family protein
MATIFTSIIKRELPAFIVAEDENYIAFLDISPLVEGHVLVVPKEEVDYIYNLSDDTLIGLHLFAKKVARAIRATIECKRIGMTVIGLEVPHAHIHLIPIQKMDDMNFANMKLSPSNKELAATAASIGAAFQDSI